MNAVRAYFEWMPIRQVDMDDNLRIWRSFSLGKLVDLVSVYSFANDTFQLPGMTLMVPKIMLDTRNYDRSITTLNWNDVC